MKIEVKFKKLTDANVWVAYDRAGCAIYHSSSLTKIQNRFVRDITKILKGKTGFTLIGICEEEKTNELCLN